MEIGNRITSGSPLSGWRLILGVVVDLMISLGILTVLHFLSPRGAYAALLAPVVMALPLVMLLLIFAPQAAFLAVYGSCRGRLWGDGERGFSGRGPVSGMIDVSGRRVHADAISF